ncbi:integrase catalytic domain-containing protein [Trichonephila clavipes]|nr:integrase catalytic domain-containing protein [Trichonephila clavipes]
MDLRKWRTNSSELNQRLKNLNFEVDEHKESLNTLIASKVLGVGWNEKSDTFYFDSSDLGTFLSKRINTKRYLLQAAGRLFDPGGRLKHSTLSEFQKHQMMLPKAHHLTDLIIEHYHKKSLHSGLQTTLYLIRQFYWIPSGQNRVRRILNKCITCFRIKTQTIYQMMGDLPRDRIVPSRPFEKVGLDYAGPIITKPNLKRSRVTLKSYIAIFICFSTKATHLEVVSDLTTEAFLACLRRFIARRSKPSVIWSDNATNFKGARNILNEWNEICKSNRIQLFSAEEGIEWNFIPPVSPHFGGLWEANIKSMKRILLKVAKSAIMNFEELTTLMAQIEAVLNSRPLSPLTSDPNDLNPLTPGHFLTNCAISSFPEPYTASDSLSYHSRWKLIQSLRDKFWNRWSTEYLTHLQTRAKWSVQNPNLMENQLVLLKDSNTKPLDWPMGRILEVFPGSDGLVRVVNVKTSTGILKRAITKVVPLPIPVDPATVEKNI